MIRRGGRSRYGVPHDAGHARRGGLREDAGRGADARTRAEEWNSHDLEPVLTRYAPDVVFRSPLAARALPGPDGIVRGLAALREYWPAGLAAHPDLRFEVLDVFEGTDTLVIVFRTEAGELRAEVLTFRDGLIVGGRGCPWPRTDVLKQPESTACRRKGSCCGRVSRLPIAGDLMLRRRFSGATEAALVTAASSRIGWCGRGQPHKPENLSACK